MGCGFVVFVPMTDESVAVQQKARLQINVNSGPDLDFFVVKPSSSFRIFLMN